MAQLSKALARPKLRAAAERNLPRGVCERQQADRALTSAVVANVSHPSGYWQFGHEAWLAGALP
jgi:hypothetical protein